MNTASLRKTALRIFLGLAALLLLYIAAVLAYGSWNDWQPEAEVPVETLREGRKEAVPDTTLSFVIWNLGYTGLGEESDFFYDSGSMLFSRGHMVRSPKELVDKNRQGIRDFISRTRADFFLFQEIDRSSRRSYFVDQVQLFSDALGPGFYAGFTPNYQAPFVAIPLFEPWKAYGEVHSGLATYSRWFPYQSTRYQLPGAFAWPTRIFQLDRCIALHRYTLQDRKGELVLMNIHHSAYDKGGKLKRQEMAFMKELCLKEYEKGNYVVVGGDWNQVPPYFAFDALMPGRAQGHTQINIEADFMPQDWLWAYDPTVATNRKLRDPYLAGQTFATVIDFFLVSPNLRVKTVKTLDLQFQFSDHQPVYLELELN